MSKKHSRSMFKIPWAQPHISPYAQKFVGKAIQSSWISGGPYVEQLERKLSRALCSSYAVTTTSGTTALHLALLGLKVSGGDEVVIPGYSFAAAANMVLAVGARPVFADVNPDTWCLDAESFERSLTKKTKAVVCVHTYGNVCDMDSILLISRRKGIAVIEDAAEALGSVYKKKYAGTWGDAGALSFQATKTLALGEGGAVLVKRKDLYERMYLLRDHGMRRPGYYYHEVPGFNFRMTNVTAALGCAQMVTFEAVLEKRKKVYEWYLKYLSACAGIALQIFDSDVNPAVWAMAVKIKPRVSKGDRDFMIRKMNEKGIETRPGFVSYDCMSHYDAPKLPVSSNLSRYVICLPFYADLKEETIRYVVQTFKGLLK